MNDIETLIKWYEMDKSQIGSIYVEILRALTRAEIPTDWDPAIALAHDFLDFIEDDLMNGLKLTNGESSKLFSFLITILVEAGQYRHETYDADPKRSELTTRRNLIYNDLLPKMGKLREHAVSVAKHYLNSSVFSSLIPDIEIEIFPLLESMGDTAGKNFDQARDRYLPFRVIQAGNIVERLYSFRLRTLEPALVGDGHRRRLLSEIYNRKYARFGTSGVRGRWKMDFTEMRAKRVLQAICDYLKATNLPAHIDAENLQGKRVVIGYDSRKNARLVAEWAAQVCLANGFKVDLANRDTPTPALVYYLTEYLNESEVAGLINCTASHNPPEWQGIKFNPRLGYPAPTSLTNFIAARANQLQLLDEYASVTDLGEARNQGALHGFDPIVNYVNWILDSGNGNDRISFDNKRIRKHFREGVVVIDEMYGVSRGYLTRLLGEIGVRHTVIHAERDPNLPDLDYANPEEPFIKPLEQKVESMENTLLGLGMDTDADRFGVVDSDGTYYRPNQVLPMLLKYLGVDGGEKGRVIATQTGSPLLEILAGMIPNNEEFYPEPGIVPAFVDHPYYHMQVGERKDQVYKYSFMVPVGIKYIEEQRRTDRSYRFLEELPDGWRNVILIGGEESSGLTTRGHVTDKDGIWANLLIMDMVAYYGKTIRQIWEETTDFVGVTFFGGRELESSPSNTGRADVDAVLEAKEAFINYFLDRFKEDATFEGLDIVYAGGIRYDFVEIQLRDSQGNDQHYLRVRASGTEPINRIYIESCDPVVARRLMRGALDRLEELSIAEIENAHSQWRLAEILSATQPSSILVQKVVNVLDSHSDWRRRDIIFKLQRLLPTVERRNQHAIRAWITALE